MRPDLARAYGVETLPSLLLFDPGGQPVRVAGQTVVSGAPLRQPSVFASVVAEVRVLAADWPRLSAPTDWPYRDGQAAVSPWSCQAGDRNRHV